MTLIYLYILFMKLLMIISASHQSTIHTLFVDPSEDPFLDPYIETVTHLNIKDIMGIPKMTDHQFLQYLYKDNSVATHRNIRSVDTSIFDPLRDAQLQHQTEIDNEWESLMVSGPIVVGFMGNLMVLASNEDFPFRPPSNYTYQYVRFPNSFRATLAQVSTDMYNALMGAHTAMDKIQLAIQQVPTHVKTAMKLITSASDAMLKSMLPRTLESVSRLATESANVANATLHRFILLQDLLGEIIQLSASTQSENEKDIKQIDIEKQKAIDEQKSLEKNLEDIKNEYNRSLIELASLREEYRRAMQKVEESSTPDLIPDGSSPQNLGEIAIGLVLNPIETISSIFGGSGAPKYRVDNTKFENAMKAAELIRERLKDAERIHDLNFQRKLAEQTTLTRIMSEMALLDVTKLNTETIIALLLKSVKHINLIREQWERMIRFFSKLATQAESTQKIVVQDFVQVIQQAQTDNLLVDPFEREFLIGILVPAATTIENGAHLLYTMAKTYYAVSSEYMINQIAGIGKMLVLQTSEERTTQLQQAYNTTLITSEKITELTKERHALYLQQMHNRQAEYTAYINNLANVNLTQLLDQ